LRTSASKGTRTSELELTVDELTVREETLVDVWLGTSQDITAGAWHTLNLDTENRDELDEFDTGTHQFTPNETGWYLVLFSANFQVGASGDRLVTRFHNVSTDTQIIRVDYQTGGALSHSHQGGRVVKLTGGDNYEVHVFNDSSDDTITANEYGSFLVVRRAFR